LPRRPTSGRQRLLAQARRLALPSHIILKRCCFFWSSHTLTSVWRVNDRQPFRMKRKLIETFSQFLLTKDMRLWQKGKLGVQDTIVTVPL
jgi:hypothetical protein